MKTKNNFKKILTLSFILSSTVLTAFAAVNVDFGPLGKIVDNFTGSVVQSVGTLLLTLATVVFFWGIVKYLWNKSKGSTEGVKSGQNFMGWGLLALFVMFSVWGIINFAQKALGNGFDNKTITIPNFQFVNSTTP